jgi:hypothetical protein
MPSRCLLRDIPQSLAVGADGDAAFETSVVFVIRSPIKDHLPLANSVTYAKWQPFADAHTASRTPMVPIIRSSGASCTLHLLFGSKADRTIATLALCPITLKMDPRIRTLNTPTPQRTLSTAFQLAPLPKRPVDAALSHAPIAQLAPLASVAVGTGPLRWLQAVRLWVLRSGASNKPSLQ